MDPLTERSAVKCKTCSHSFPNFGLLEKHCVEVHGAGETMRCHFGCETLFKRRMTIIFHVRSQKHRGAGSAWIGCEICDAFAITNGFPDEGRLSDHATRIHGKDIKLPPKSQQFNIICPLCTSQYGHRKALMEHIQLKHLDHLYSHLLGLGDDAVKEFLDNKLYTCDICLPREKITFNMKSGLNRHIKRFHSKQQVKKASRKRGKCSRKYSTTPTINHKLIKLEPHIHPESEPLSLPVSLIKQELNVQPKSEPEFLPVPAIKGFECSVCLVEFTCLPELESHWTVHFRHYIHYSDGIDTQKSVEEPSTDSKKEVI